MVSVALWDLFSDQPKLIPRLLTTNIISAFNYCILTPPVPPEFLVPLSDVTCDSGESVTLRCKVCGRPRASVTWKGPDQNNLTNNGHVSTAYR